MPVLSKRRLQLMLDELPPQVRASTANDLLARLNHKKDASQVLPDEFELTCRWALNRSFTCEHEPEWWADGYLPDVYVHDFLPGIPAAIEITARSDISAEAVMDAIAQQISTLASKVGQKGLGDYLYHVFGETSGYESGTYFRRVLAPKDYVLSHAVADQIAAWVKAGAVGTLGIIDTELALNVSRKPFKQVRFHNCHSSMPPEAHSLTENPLYELLRRKRRQVRAAPEGALRFFAPR